MPKTSNAAIRFGLRLLVTCGMILGSTFAAVAQSTSDSMQSADIAEKNSSSQPASAGGVKAEATTAAAPLPAADPVTHPAVKPAIARHASNDIRMIRYGRQTRIYGVR